MGGGIGSPNPSDKLIALELDVIPESKCDIAIPLLWFSFLLLLLLISLLDPSRLKLTIPDCSGCTGNCCKGGVDEADADKEEGSMLRGLMLILLNVPVLCAEGLVTPAG